MLFSQQVEVLQDFSNTIGISPFYVSFLITPIVRAARLLPANCSLRVVLFKASNASEVISSLIFAGRKTNEKMSITLCSLYGLLPFNSCSLN